MDADEFLSALIHWSPLPVLFAAAIWSVYAAAFASDSVGFEADVEKDEVDDDRDLCRGAEDDDDDDEESAQSGFVRSCSSTITISANDGLISGFGSQHVVMRFANWRALGEAESRKKSANFSGSIAGMPPLPTISIGLSGNFSCTNSHSTNPKLNTSAAKEYVREDKTSGAIQSSDPTPVVICNIAAHSFELPKSPTFARYPSSINTFKLLRSR